MKKIVVLLGLCAGAVGVTASQTELLSNYQDTQSCSPIAIYEPESIEEVQEIVREARKSKTTIMTGNRKFLSQIDAACADDNGIQITLSRMNKIVNIDKEQKTVTVQAGMRFNDFTAEIAKDKLSVAHVTELSIFTIGGMLGSSTHGSNLTEGASISDFVTSITIVDGKGDRREVKGNDLAAVRTNLGVLGVVVEVTIQAQDQYKVEAKQLTDSDEDLENEILDLARDNYSLNLAWFPHHKKWAGVSYNKVPVETEGDAHNAQADVGNLEIFGFSALFGLAHHSPELTCLASGIRLGTRNANIFKTDDKKEASTKVGFSHKMQHFKCLNDEKCVWNTMPIRLQEIAIDMNQLPALITDIRQVLAQKGSCFPLNGIYMRFAKASDSLIGMSAGRDTAYVGVEYVLNNRGMSAPINFDVFQEIEQMILDKYDGRPHWGKNSIPVFIDAAKKYPRWNEFMEAKEDYDPDNVFTNSFWRRIINSEDQPLPESLTDANCVATGKCYCTKDSHCNKAKGETCRTGRYFEDARICRKN